MRFFVFSLCACGAVLPLAHTQTVAAIGAPTAQSASFAPSQPTKQGATTTVVTLIDEQREAATKLLKNNANNLKVEFRQNKGQWNSPALYRMEAPQMRMQFLENGMEFGKTVRNAVTQQEAGFIWNWAFLRADKDIRLVARNPKGGTNYVVDGWKKVFVAQNSQLWYENVWRNTDAFFYGATNDEFLFGFILYPYADPTDLKIHIGGCTACSILANGDFLLKMADGEQRMHRPQAYQIIDNKEVAVEIAYKLTDEGDLTYAIANYRDDAILIIQ